MTEWKFEEGEFPPPAIRRQDGFRDARARKPRLSWDEEYNVGYDLEKDIQRMKKIVKIIRSRERRNLDGRKKLPRSVYESLSVFLKLLR